MGKKVLITGVSGQDGSYLSELLLSKGYEVHGIIRRHSIVENQDQRLVNVSRDIRTYYADLLDCSSLEKIVRQVEPEHVYSLAAQSHVGISFEIPQYTVQVNSLGVLNLLEAVKKEAPNAKFYQASSSEIFGDSVDADTFQRETTDMKPVSPYGCSKLFSYNLVRNYRKAYNMFASNGILFNHGSPRRGSNFVEQKVVKGAVSIKRGLQKNLVLGNMDSYRDWGHSKDYVRAMHMILEYPEAKDFVIATGVTHSIRDLCQYVFSRLGMNYEDYVVQDQQYMRPEELKYLRGDSSYARKELGWVPEYTFETMLDEMIEDWERKL